MNLEVFLSILAMDSYQRGYAPGINGLAQVGEGVTVKIGQATILDVPLPAGSVESGFYASPYNWNGTTVISYRGTDFDILSDGKGIFDTEFIKDLQYGWTSFLKVPPVPGAQGSDLGERCGRARVPRQHGRIGSLDVLLRHGSDGVL